ncbi:MAG: SgcJ/EcaC family oxidoreductase [Planctomycetia bacterium]|nr:SgcJ/EcaC family oxidoreductase [Planctomycetia bacterium]
MTHARSTGLAALGLVALAGCGSRPAVEEGRADVPARATASADPARPLLRPLPQVITKPKPFRLPDVIGAVPSLEPATMNARNELVLPAAPREPARAAASEARPAVAEVAAMLRDYLGAFNRHDPAALAAHWAADAENVDLESGETTRGRAAVEEVFQALFAEDRGATIDIDVESIRPLRDDVALVDGVSRIAFTGAAAAGPHEAGSRFSAVVVKQAGRWMIESVREAPLPASRAAAPAARPLDALDWLVGAWEDVGDGVTASTRCFWSPGRAFLVRDHAVAFDTSAVRPAAGDDSIPGLLPPGTGGSRAITEIIGWDADRGEVRSWLFTSEGRFCEATWTQEGGAWRVRYAGGGPDAAATGSLLVARAGPDELAVRCDDDGLADLMPPACDFVRTARPGPSD